jgi:membrane-anchored glycerophosphoryl diester phosphodiesterase (GDPDase)
VGAQLLNSLLSLGTFVVAIIVLIVAIRWVLAYQAVFVEDLTLVKALRRSAKLTEGARTRIGLAFVAMWFLIGLFVSIVGYGVGIVAWLVTSSIDVGVIAFVVVLTVSGFVYMPWMAATLTHIYRVRVGAPGATTDVASPPTEAPATEAPATTEAPSA